MKYFQLPQTNLNVSRIALGCMRIADKSVDEVDELIKTALDAGINFFDHADIYGGGKSEKVFGEVLKHRPDALCDPKEVAEAFDELYEAGKVKYFGVSNHTPLQIELLQKYSKYPIIINQLQLSIVHSVMIDSGLNMNMKEAWAQDKDGGVLDYCRLKDITIQPWSVVQASWAEGTFLDNPDYQKLNDVMQALADEYHVTKLSLIHISEPTRH